jgi:hypothetical protein
MASAQGGGGSNDNNTENDLACVYRAVDQGASADQVRAILAGGPRTRHAKQQWLAAVLEHKGGANGDETPLQRAHRRRDGPLAGALLEHGADARVLGPKANPLAICIAYGQVNSLRVLLHSGRHSADERLAYSIPGTVAGADEGSREFCCPVHLCVVPPRLSDDDDFFPPPQLECLSVLVREFGADIDGRDADDKTPLHWFGRTEADLERRAFDALMALDPDVNARDNQGYTPMFWVVTDGNEDMMRQLLARGASSNVITSAGFTPLFHACCRCDKPGAAAACRAMVSALLPLSSTETRRSVSGYTGRSALDYLLKCLQTRSPEPWERHAIEELLSSRVPVRPHKAALALPLAARLVERREAELARRNRSAAMQWRAHEDMVGLAFDFQDLRAAEEGVRRREMRVQELEEELRRRGIGTEEEEEDDGGGGGGSSN